MIRPAHISADTLLASVGRLMKPRHLLAAAVIGTVFVSGVAQAQQNAKQTPEPIEIVLVRKKVTIVDGKEVLVSAATAKPGDVLEETATYTNRSKKTFRVEATLPVPQYTEFVAGTAAPTGVRATADGTSYAAVPLKRQTKSASGVVVEQLVPVSEYKSLRWSAISLAPEKQFVATARFRLSDGAAETPPAVSTAASTAGVTAASTVAPKQVR